ncbi:hypothetical protein BAUCODRAFT_28843 [Baudoinia panamericana UAMH 10762]|uniref:Uncharacterized protein n=1 Tax=Baudoinia panamericana (strain UAMH 10762) TaxID=717646 RepID=M2N8N0_BAUPA|nr:uncharacterized protein BAUCODRAFT_28843 [Baudoinia panamericana UAMH 10762]EMD00489.1 hypothetical protein BAUCODRAFT_28843 [Baudoinia panamericana UAMH 10762]
MPPIPLHIDDPITPQKPQAVEPQTAAAEPPAQPFSGPASNVATTTAPAAAPSSYPAARPGAAAVPAPTSYVPRPHQQPTQTQAVWEEEDRPAPPQPGAVPVPPSQYAPRTPSNAGIVPPPPRGGDSAQHQGTAFTGHLNQMYTPPAAQAFQHNYAPTHSTSTAGIVPGQATTPSRSGPTTLNLGPVQQDERRISAEHPPGYVQNAYAQEMSSAQRASLDQETKREGLAAQLGLTGHSGFGAGTPSRVGDPDASDGVGGVLDAAKGWMNKAGAALAEGERSVWKWMDGK